MLRALPSVLLCVATCWLSARAATAQPEVPLRLEVPLSVALFDIDATPPIGSSLAYSPTRSIVAPLRCKGLVLLSNEAPIVLCAIDWLGIANDGNRLFRERLAAAAGTTPDRVAVHTLHQHDAPWCDFSADALAQTNGATGIIFDSGFAREMLERAVQAVHASLAQSVPISHIGIGSAEVFQVASNRRILGPDGHVKGVRWTATKDPELRAAPEGVIDPQLRSLSLFRNSDRVVTLTYYATHPQSYYGNGDVNPDFPGLARDARQQTTGSTHIHFCGAGGNIGAGKYNDGSPENRAVLAGRVEDAMRRAMDSEQRTSIVASEVHWTLRSVQLPMTQRLDIDQLQKLLEDTARPVKDRIYAAAQLAWMRRCEAGDSIDLTCLRLGPARILHMPGELFVEY